MPELFRDDGAAVDQLIQEIARPLGPRRGVPMSEFTRSVAPRANRRRTPRVCLATTDVVVQINKQVVNGIDFSLQGIQLRSGIRLVPGATVTMNIQWREGVPSMALGRVMWATFERPNRLTEPHYRVGVVFESSDFRAIRSILERCGLGRPVDVEILRSR